MADGTVNVLPREMGSWWGSDPVAKRSEEVDIAALGLDGELVVGECKWEARPVESDVIGVLARRAELVDPGATDVRLMLFSKSGFSEACYEEAAERGNVELVSLEDMFR